VRSSATADYAPWEVGVALTLAAAAQVGGVLLVHFGQKDVVSDLPEIDKGMEMPVKVKPVLDLEGVALKQGGKKPVLPDMWQAPKPPARPQTKAPDQAFASTKADENEVPEKSSKPMAQADAAVPPPDAGDKDIPDAATEPSDAGTTEPTDKPEGNKQEGVDGGVADGKSTDATERNQKATYAARIGAFLAGIGRRGCGGGKGTVSGSVSLSGGTITSVSIGSSDPDLSGVGPAMQGAVGQQIPPPPDEHPDWMPSSFAVTIVCK